MVSLEDMNRCITSFFKSSGYVYDGQDVWTAGGKYDTRKSTRITVYGITYTNKFPSIFTQFNKIDIFEGFQFITLEFIDDRSAGIHLFKDGYVAKRLDVSSISALFEFLNTNFLTGEALQVAVEQNKRLLETEAEKRRDKEAKRLATLSCVQDQSVLMFINFMVTELKKKNIDTQTYPEVKSTFTSCIHDKINKCIDANFDRLLSTNASYSIQNTTQVFSALDRLTNICSSLIGPADP